MTVILGMLRGLVELAWLFVHLILFGLVVMIQSNVFHPVILQIQGFLVMNRPSELVCRLALIVLLLHLERMRRAYVWRNVLGIMSMVILCTQTDTVLRFVPAPHKHTPTL